jgi:hypothetical protein
MEEDVTELSVEESRALFDRVCRESLGVSADEFLELYPDEIPKAWPHDAVVRLEILLPFAVGD